VKDACFHVLRKQTHIFSSLFLEFFINGLTLFVSWWHSHIGWCYHYWPHLNRLGISSNFFLWSGYDNGGSGEGKILLWPLPNKHVFSSHHKRFLNVFTNSSTTFFINVLTWHGWQKTLEAFFYWWCSFYRQKMLMVLQKAQVASISNWAIIEREGYFRLGASRGLPPLF
jgi:hypothetical protein